MLNSNLETMLFGLSASAAAEVFLWSILAVFSFALFEAKNQKQSRFLEHAPTILTSLGILGTFTGIVIGLLHFDAQKIDDSIPQLLSGLKTAFITSLAGMFASILFKAADSFWFAPKREQSDVPESVTPDDIFREIAKTNKHLEALKQSMAGDEESSLAGQMRLMRSENRDTATAQAEKQRAFQEKLFEEMQNFAELLSKSATEQVIEALKQVIVEFNEKLTEQFGENFKRLDESVKKLVIWQEQYMQQLEQMSEQYSLGVKAIDDTREAVGQISEKTATIPETVGKLQGVMEVNQHQIQELQRHLEAFVTMRDKAVEAVPTINSQMDEIGKRMVESTETVSKMIHEGAAEFGQSVERTSASLQEMANNIQSQSESVTENLQDVATDVSKTASDMLARLNESATSMRASLDQSVEAVLTEMRKTVENTTQTMESEVSKSVGRTEEGINKQLDAMDKAMEDELQRVMTHMGQALTSITRQFSQDYEKLVNAMNQVVRQQAG